MVPCRSPADLGEDLVEVEEVLAHAVDVQRVHGCSAGHQEERQHDQLAEILFTTN